MLSNTLQDMHATKWSTCHVWLHTAPERQSQIPHAGPATRVTPVPTEIATEHLFGATLNSGRGG
jgi:hypothetical protein